MSKFKPSLIKEEYIKKEKVFILNQKIIIKEQKEDEEEDIPQIFKKRNPDETSLEKKERKLKIKEFK